MPRPRTTATAGTRGRKHLEVATIGRAANGKVDYERRKAEVAEQA